MLINMDALILSALQEDMPHGDITTQAIFSEGRIAKARLLAKQDGVVAGLFVFQRVFELLDHDIQIECYVKDGDAVRKGQLAAIVRGDVRAILSGERTALNYLQRMSGIATHTRQILRLLEGSGITLLDTRKTTPNNRPFEKYAVKAGGGSSHRYCLSDGIMLKDNHIAAAGGIQQAVAMAKANASFVHKIEVEVETLDMLREALDAGADIIMLDNMDTETMKEAVRIAAGRVKIECSGNVTAENIAGLRDIGVDYISSGALTHSSPILDFSLKNLVME